MSHHHSIVLNHNMNIINDSCKTVAEVRHLGIVTNQNNIHEEIKVRLHSGVACYHPVLDLLSLCLLSKNVKLKRAEL
jgi:hypothetical protein